MKLKRDILQIVFGAILMALFIQFGIIKTGNPFQENLFGAFLVMILSRVFSIIFGGL